VNPDKQHTRTNHNLYRTLSHVNTKAAEADLSLQHVHQGFNVFGHIRSIVSDLTTPDLLHTMQITMLDHLPKWRFHFIKTHEWLDKYNVICLSVPAYHNLKGKNMSYKAVSQHNGNEEKQMSQFLLGVVTWSQRAGSPAQHPIFTRAIVFTPALL